MILLKLVVLILKLVSMILKLVLILLMTMQWTKVAKKRKEAKALVGSIAPALAQLNNLINQIRSEQQQHL